MTKTKLNSERMKIDNPMFKKENVEKMKETIKERYPNWGDFNIGKKHPKLREMNLTNNPMKNQEIVKKAISRKDLEAIGLKISKTRKRLFKEGKLKSNIIDFLEKVKSGELPHPNKGKKSPSTTKRNLENNPMWNPEFKNKSISKSVETRKRLYKEGKLVAWNKGMSKEEFLKHMPYNFSENFRKITQTEEVQEKIKKTNATPESREKCRKTIEERGINDLSSQRMKNGGAMKAMAGNKRQSKPEQFLLKIIEQNNLPFNYVGKGGVIFRGENHSFNPDFLSKNPKHIIEVFGDYFHNLPERKILDVERLATYSKYGYKTLIIWEHELKNPNQVIDKINKFVGGN